jgi:hypothetical protein
VKRNALPDSGRLIQEKHVSLELLDALGSMSSILGLLIVVPTVIAAYYQSFRARQEAQQVRDGTLHSRDCLEFIAGDGTCINVVPLETLHSLPKEGDVLLLPGQGAGDDSEFLPGAYLVDSVEHIYASPEKRLQRRRHEARLVKAVAHVTALNPTFPRITFQGRTAEESPVE